MVLCYGIIFCQGIFASAIHSLLFKMKLVIFEIAICLTLAAVAASVHGIKTCKKIDSCRCSTDEGEINLWSLAGQSPNGARFNISSAAQATTYYQWNPCSPWTQQRDPCGDSAVCQLNRKSASEISRVNIGEHKLSECVLDEENGQCLLTYKVSGDNKIKTSIALMCDDKEIGKVDPMKADSSFYSTSLHSICACPGRCLLDAKQDMGIRFDSSNVGGSGLSIGAIVGIAIAGLVFLIVLMFAIFICCLRRKLPSGVPKPSICTTVKFGLGIIKKKACPCC